MAQEADDVLRECLLLKDEVERQRRLIEELTRPRHWSQDGPRGKQATAIHQALDRMLERVVKVRNRIRPGSPAAMLQAEPTREGEGDSPIRDACDARLSAM